jgi:hypothetical protein
VDEACMIDFKNVLQVICDNVLLISWGLPQVAVKEELVHSGEELQDSDLNYQVCSIQSPAQM